MFASRVETRIVLYIDGDFSTSGVLPAFLAESAKLACGTRYQLDIWDRRSAPGPGWMRLTLSSELRYEWESESSAIR